MARRAAEKETDSVEIPVVRSASWLRRAAMALVLAGIARGFLVWPEHSRSWKVLPSDVALSWTWADLSACLWIAGTGFLLGFLAEAASRGEFWAGQFARGACNLLLVVSILGAALCWASPAAWVVLALAAWARISASAS